MPITIGKKREGDFQNPLVLLTDCHRRIEHFFHILIAVTKQAQGGNMTEDQRSALEVALRYFREAAPRHTQDEEESLFPRLRKSSGQEVKEKMALMDHLNSDHVKMQTAHNNVDNWFRRWLDNGQLPEQTVQQLS
jgi:iron-sulfur cluster repair protein YtfE (RIC family)